MMDLEGVLLSACAPNLQIQVGSAAEKPRLLHPKNGGASGLEKLCTVPWAPCVPYFPTPASVLRAAPLTDDMKSESEVTQSCPTLSDPMDCSLPGSSVHGIFQARVLEWGAIAFSEYHVYYYKIQNKLSVSTQTGLAKPRGQTCPVTHTTSRSGAHAFLASQFPRGIRRN